MGATETVKTLDTRYHLELSKLSQGDLYQAVARRFMYQQVLTQILQVRFLHPLIQLKLCLK